MVSYSNFGSDTSRGSLKVRHAVEQLQQRFPDLKVDGAAAPEATAIYSFQSVDGAWDGVGDIGIITVSLSANP